MKRAKFSRAEKRMLIAVNCLIGLLLVLSWWRLWLSALPVLNLPTPKLPQPNAFDVYVQAGNMAIPHLVPSGLDWSPLMPATRIPSDLLYKAPLVTRENWFRQNRLMLQTLRSGFAYHYLQPPSRSGSDELPHLFKVRELARLLAIESQTKAERGNWGGASQSALDILRFGIDIPRGGPLRATLTGQTIQEMGRKQFWKVLPHLSLSETRTALARMEEIRARNVSYAASLQEEEWSMQAALLEGMRHKILWAAINGPEDSALSRLRSNLFNNRLIMRHFTEIMDAEIANAQRLYTAPQQPVAAPPWSLGDPIVPAIAPIYPQERVSATNNQTQNALLLVALALRAFRLEHGVYPKQLIDLVPRYLQQLPIDPFGGGEPLRYKPAQVKYKVAEIPPKPVVGSGPSLAPITYQYEQTPYTLFSIGPDGVDNGGKPIEKDDYDNIIKRRYQVSGNSTGDIVAGLNF